MPTMDLSLAIPIAILRLEVAEPAEETFRPGVEGLRAAMVAVGAEKEIER